MDRYFEEGRDDFRGGSELECCPYPEGTHEAESWELGWLESFNEDKEGESDGY